MKIAKKVLKTIGVLLGFIVVIVLGYIIYLYASYHRIEDNKSLTVESHTETKRNTNNRKTIFSNYIQYWIRSLYARFQLFYGWRKIILGKEQEKCS